MTHPTRRQFLISLSGAAMTQGLTSQDALAESSSQTVQPAGPYQPRYFTAPEWRFLTAAVLRLIPTEGDGPDGVSAGVHEFIDRQMDLPYGHGAYAYMQGPFVPESHPTLGYQLRYTPRELYRLGIAGADAACERDFGKRFADLGPSEQDKVLGGLEGNSLRIEGPPAAAFFNQLLRNVREGYFSDPMYGGNKHMGGWKLIGFPGARADFTDWLDQQGKPYPYGPVSVNGSRDA
jgi:gluconate 2-dehydrogenase gamma chain